MNKHLFLFLTSTFLSISPIVAQSQTYTPSNRTPQQDNSIGTIVNPAGASTFNITGGLSRGLNLFHSFTDFSIPTGGSANFTNPARNQSIITRVTGNLFSDINGLVNTNGANFLLINPNGVVFGTNAQLNVGKAFVTSTANGIDFVDAAGRNYNFGVNQAGDTPLLSIGANVAFNPARLIMGGSNSGSRGIENYGTLRTNNSGQYIGLIGGNINFNGGQIIAPGAKVELGGLVQTGTVGFSLDNGVQFPVNVERGTVSLLPNGTAPSIIDVRSGGGGSVGVVAKDINVQGTGTRIRAGISAGLGAPTATAGDIKLETSEAIKISDGAGILNTVGAGGEGNAGDIEIVSGNLSVTNGAQLNGSTFGKGNAGKIKISTTGNISFDSANAFNQIGAGAQGKSGGIEISTSNLSITNGTQLSTSTLGKGDAGKIKISTTGNVSFDGGSGAFSTVEKGAEGKAGGIEISTGSLSVSNNSGLIASTFGKGDAGDIKVIAKDSVSLAGNASVIFSTLGAGGVGKGGNIDIITGSLLLRDGAQVLTGISDANGIQPSGIGDAGNIKVIVNGTVDIAGVGSGILNPVGIGTVGNGGNITIDAGSVSLRDGSAVSASTYGQGNAGNVKVTVTDAVTLADAAIFSSVELGSVGKGGNIDVIAGSLSLQNGAQLASSIRDSDGIKPAGIGSAGNVKVKVSGAIDFVGKKDIFSSGILSFVGTGAVGTGGSITVDAGSFALRDGAQLSAATYGQGNAGNITINATDFVTITGKSGSSNSALFVDSQSQTGKAGDLIVSSPQITLDNGGKINAGSFSGNGGNIKIKQADLLLLRRGGRITTNAGGTPQSGGNGGNINIDSKLIVAIPTENSDISANAVKGRGGNVNINTQGLFGIQFRSSPTANSDITASSDFGQSGNVQINTPGVDPGKDTGELPAVPNDASRQISETCSASQRDNKFYITGRGGLPPNASEPQESEALWQDAREVKQKPATTANQPAQLAPPAIGWVFEPNGRVRLIAAQTAGGVTGTRAICPNVRK
jgi:filamentous hemagglutinin family protein